jgi:hypothetical protein
VNWESRNRWNYHQFSTLEVHRKMGRMNAK